MIKNCHKNIMGTISFDGKFPGMRKEQDFIVYPMQDSGFEITIQSDHRFGKINLNTGESIISANRAQYANGMWLAICIATKKSISFVLSVEDRQLKFEKWFENEDETRRFYCEAKRDGIIDKGQAYSPEKAEKRATDDLIMREKNLSPISINWENTPESFLADVKLGEVCVDFSPDMLELSMA